MKRQEWTRWPAAVAETSDVWVEEFDPTVQRWTPVQKERGLALYRGRNPGTRYDIVPHSGAWRSYGEVVIREPSTRVSVKDSVNVAWLQQFTRSYGALFNETADDEAFGRGSLEIAVAFRRLARFWAKPDADGVSYYRATTDPGALHTVPWLYGWVSSDRPPPKGTLVAFLINSALDHLRREVSMRRCAVCGNWLELSRSDRIYCDVSCRMAAYAGKSARGRRRTPEGL